MTSARCIDELGVVLDGERIVEGLRRNVDPALAEKLGKQLSHYNDVVQKQLGEGPTREALPKLDELARLMDDVIAHSRAFDADDAERVLRSTREVIVGMQVQVKSAFMN